MRKAMASFFYGKLLSWKILILNFESPRKVLEKCIPKVWEPYQRQSGQFKFEARLDALKATSGRV